MRAGSAVVSGLRYAASAGLHALLIVAIVVALVVALATATGQAPGGANKVFAGKGGKGHLSVGGPSIVLDQAVQGLELGSRVTFTTRISGLTGNEWPMVYVRCLQDGDVVYGQLDHPDTTFVLGGGSSPWWGVGGTARCTAYLKAYANRGDSRTLATSESFDAN